MRGASSSERRIERSEGGARTWRASLFAIALLAVLLSQGSSFAQERARVVVWHAYRGEEEQALRDLARAFERENRGVQVVLLAQPFGAYASKLESAIPTGNGPDLFIDAHDRIASYASGHLLAEIAPLDAARFESRIDPRHRAAFTHEGTLYGFPLSLKTAALYVNEDLVHGDVDTLEAIEALQMPEGRFALAMEAESCYWTAGLFAAYGAPLLTDDGEWGLRGPDAERALADLARLVDEGAVPEESSGDLLKRLFSDGRAATAITGPFLAPDLPAGLRWRVQPLPTIEGAGGEPMRPFVTVEGIFLAAHAEHREEARRFADYLLYGEAALVRAQRARQVVTDREAWENPALADDAFLSSFRRAAEAGVVTPTHPHMRMVYVPADSAIRKTLRGTASPHDALEEGRHRFDDVTRPLPEPVRPEWGMLALGALLLIGVYASLRRLRDPEVRVALKASMPAYRYVTHAAVAVGLLVILPLAVGAATSFFAGRGTDMYFVGIANYIDILGARGGELLGHGSFWLVLLTTVLWTVLNVTLHVVIGVALALLLHRPYLHLKGIYRVLLILPWAVPNYVTALAWKGMFHRQFGAVNAILASLGVEPVSWFSHWATAFSANVATNTWLGFPFMMVVTLGALTSIPNDIYEAAAVDGANAWQRFRLITMPLLVPFLAPAVAMGSVWTFNMFNVVFLVSGGEPDGGTEILVSEAYRWAFTRGNQYGYAAAYAVLIFLLLFVTTRLAARPSKKKTTVGAVA